MAALPPGMTAADADNVQVQNTQDIEINFAKECIKHCETYQRILGKVLKKILPRNDDTLYESFKAKFPEYFGDTSKLKMIDEEEVKSDEGKIKWRAWIEENKDYSGEKYAFGTLLRRNAEEEYTEENSMFVVRIQFQVFEIARNRLGLNDVFHEKYQAKKELNEEKK